MSGIPARGPDRRTTVAPRPRRGPLLQQFGFARERLTDRLAGPVMDSGTWRLSHLSELLALRADHTDGSHSLPRDDYAVAGDAATAIAAFDAAATAWRTALLGVDDPALDTVGHSTYPHGSDPEDPFIDIVWWVNQELLHHGAEIALLRDLYRARQR
ncbi:DinB family protein [Streptomyces sp. NPDC026206]|uniref:DinB family protein n=1 Tax=Streptomyces sp. NPDC026206 TaxID=3157089 RepID=UPI0033E484EF